jgi:hypothetical protein
VPRSSTVLALVIACSGACGFSEGLPRGATVLCTSTAQCPSGQQCDLAAHVCTAPGTSARGPRVVSAKLTPASAGDGAVVTLAVDADAVVDVQTPAHAPVLHFVDAASAPPFALATAQSSAHIELTTVVAAAEKEGFYTLASVDLCDANGHCASSLVDGVSFKIDRTKPEIEDLVVTAGTDGVASDQPGTNNVSISFLTSEPIAPGNVKALLGTLPLPCVASSVAEQGIDCTAAIDAAAVSAGAVVAGANPIVVTATDDAGNATTVSTQVEVDLDPPAVVAGSVRVSIDGRADAPFAAVGSTIEIELLVDEDLAADPVLKVGGGLGINFVKQPSSQQRFYVFDAHVGQVPVDGVYGIDATLVDRFGHSGTAAVPLPPPYDAGIHFFAVPQSPCTIPPRADGSTCTDFDGDGVFGPSPGCSPNPVDCDDNDPLTYPGALEIAGDAKDNACSGGADAALDGIHVDAARGNDGNDGSAAAPVLSFAAALSLAQQKSVPRILLAEGQYVVDETLGQIDREIYGGLDPITWTHSAGAVSTLAAPSGDCGFSFIFVSSSVLRDLAFAASISVNQPSVLSDVDVNCTFAINAPVTGDQLKSDPLNGIMLIHASAGGTRIFHSDLEVLGIDAPEVFIDASALHQGVHLSAGAALTIINSAIFAAQNEPTVDCEQCASLLASQDNLIGEAGLDIVFVGGGAASAISVLNTNIRAPADSIVFDLGDAGFGTFTNFRLDQVGGVLVDRGAGVSINHDSAGYAELAACAWPGCVSSGGGADATIALSADGLHLDPTSLGVVNSGYDTTLTFGVPTAVAGDVDGNCRYADGQPDTGPQEL